MAKETYIELECIDGRKKFSVEHADNILRMKFHASWNLPEDSEWTWSAEKGFEKRKAENGKRKAEAAADTDKGIKGSMGGAKLQGAE